MTRGKLKSLAVLLGVTIGLVSTASFGDEAWILSAQSGGFERTDPPVRFELPDGAVADALRRSLAGSAIPKLLRLNELRSDGTASEPIPAQVESIAGASGPAVRITWILKGTTAAGTERRYRFDPSKLEHAAGPWSLSDPSTGAIDLKHGERRVFRYNVEPVSNAQYKAIQNRNAYIHPAYTPSGALITGDFSKFHPHHRGFFLAYTKTQVGKLHPDFWNIHGGSGKIAFDGVGSTRVGPVTAHIETRHRWEATGGGPVLRERWEIEAYDIPGSPFWMFDLTATQQAVGEPLELLPYRYGGMAYRGPEPFVKGPLDVLTSAGLDRRNGDQKPARWVDLTGPVSEGSDRYGGAMILDHLSNVNHPSVARIHPTSLPFFCFTPAHDVKVTIDSKTPSVFRYRVVIHDGRPDRVRDDRLWHDFAEPVRVALVRAGGGD